LEREIASSAASRTGTAPVEDREHVLHGLGLVALEQRHEEVGLLPPQDHQRLQHRDAAFRHDDHLQHLEDRRHRRRFQRGEVGDHAGGIGGRGRREHRPEPREPGLVSHLGGKRLLQLLSQRGPVGVLGELIEAAAELVHPRHVVLDEQAVEELGEDVLQGLGVGHAVVYSLEDRPHHLGHEPPALVLVELLLHPLAQLVGDRRRAHRHRPHRLDVVDALAQVGAGDAREGDRGRIVGSASAPALGAQSVVQVAVDLADLDLDLAVVDPFELEALHHHVLDVLELGAPHHREGVLTRHHRPLVAGHRHQGELEQLVEGDAGAEEELADPAAEELVGDGLVAVRREQRGRAGNTGEGEVLGLDPDHQRPPVRAELLEGGVGHLEGLGMAGGIVPVQRHRLHALREQREDVCRFVERPLLLGSERHPRRR
jgi:hypothetical protein